MGGGGTGAALAWDLSLRGVEVTLVERGELTSGTTGRHHGQLHSGARYAVADERIARECMEETRILRRIAPECIEYNGGLFVAADESGAEWAPRFIGACARAGIPAKELPLETARKLEPGLAHGVLRAVWVPDGTFDAFRLPLSFFAGALSSGARILPFREALSIERLPSGTFVTRALDRSSTPFREVAFESDAVVCATGAWAGESAARAGVRADVSPAPGAMVAVTGRLVSMVVSRLGPAGDGDIVVPQRGLSIIGSTQRSSDSADAMTCAPGEREFLLARADELVEGFSSRPTRAAWAAARPLSGTASGDEERRSISRDFTVIDHAREGKPGLFTITGGKATVLRAMARDGADAACGYLGVRAPCRTAELALPSWRDFYRNGGGA